MPILTTWPFKQNKPPSSLESTRIRSRSGREQAVPWGSWPARLTASDWDWPCVLVLANAREACPGPQRLGFHHDKGWNQHSVSLPSPPPPSCFSASITVLIPLCRQPGRLPSPPPLSGGAQDLSEMGEFKHVFSPSLHPTHLWLADCCKLFSSPEEHCSSKQ